MADDIIANLPQPNQHAPDEESNMRDSEDTIDMVIETEPQHRKRKDAEALEEEPQQLGHQGDLTMTDQQNQLQLATQPQEVQAQHSRPPPHSSQSLLP
jgi:hypothetical protein